MANTQCVKAGDIKAMLNYLVEKFGPDAPQKIMEQLSPEDRTLLSKPILASSWLPEKTYHDLLFHADRIFGKGDYSLCYDVGTHSARFNVPKLYSVFIRMGNPSILLSSTATFWGLMHNSGKLIVAEKTSNSAVAHLKDFYHPPHLGNPAFCYAMRGFITEIFKMTGADGYMDEVQCAALGAPCCIFKGEWT